MALIRNYGLYWDREKVNWGSRGKGNEGYLWGYTKWRGKNTECVDFRYQAGIYILYEGPDISSQRVVYVGQAGSGSNDGLLKRLRDHTRDHLWNRWQRFSWFGFYDVGAQLTLIHANPEKALSETVAGALDHLEGILIAALEPHLNKQGSQWKNAVTEYYQWHDDEQDMASGDE